MRWSLTTAGALLMLWLCGTASATFVPGPNGKLVFTSGRAPGNDNNARIFVADYPLGTPMQVTSTPSGTNIQHRHPDWSPDHSKIVYAAGTAFTGPFGLYIKDLATGSETEFVAPAAGQDRPTWSPDGTKIAYGSGGNLYVKPVDGGAAVPVTNGVNDERPVWSSDGNTLYFNRGPEYNGTPGTGDKDIYKISPVSIASAAEKVTGTVNIDDWQANISPDDSRLCFTRGPKNSTDADIYVVNVTGTLPATAVPFAAKGGTSEINCAWAPDGSKVLYDFGAFNAGQLFTRDPDAGNESELTAMNVGGTFDGNTDWATNFSPACDDKDLNVNRNAFVAVPLSCTDPDSGQGAAPPTPEPLESDDISIVSPPVHGNIGSISAKTVIYTPPKDFTGTDTFTYRGNDQVSDGPPATITIHVNAPATGPGGGATDTTAPVVSRVTVSRKRWRRGGALPAAAARAKVGMTIGFGLDEAGTARIAFAKAKPGRRVGGRCVAPTRANRSRRACTRFVAAGSFTLAAKQGANQVRFQGRLNAAKRLGLGRYRVAVRVTDAAGNASKPATGPTFRIVRR